jgi:hypothetical protein
MKKGKARPTLLKSKRWEAREMEKSGVQKRDNLRRYIGQARRSHDHQPLYSCS